VPPLPFKPESSWCPSSRARACGRPRRARAAQGEIHCEHPDASLYTFVGNLLLRPPLAPGAAAALPLSPASVLLRGSALQNTRWALGAVVFAGHETKARMRRLAHVLVRCSLSVAHYLLVLSQHLIRLLVANMAASLTPR